MDFEMGMDTTSKVLMALALGGLALSLVLFASAWLYPYLCRAWDKASHLARAVFCGAVVCACLFGGSKQKTGGISYPKTDNEVAYLTDVGSYVTNDAVHVAFTRLPMVPSSATFYLDYCAIDATNAQGVATNWVNAKTATFGELSVPFDFAFANATNYNWLAYTDWTPGPAVQTNGVWHAYWGIDKKEGRYFIPVRTCVRDGSEVIATPKSKWDAATRTPDDYVQDGLIAMWDGEWNSGRGVHDSAATIWKDLIGSHNLTMLDMTTSSRCWEKNCAYTDYGNLTYYSSSAIAEARAIECVYMQTKYGSSYAGTLVMNNVVIASTEAQGYVVTILTRFHNRSGVDGLQVAYDKFAYFDTKSVFGTIYTYTAQYSTVYRNAVGFEVQTMSGDSWSGSAISIAGRGDATTYNSPGRFYCIRIYNRELTAEEVAHNYAVDKARFGTGNE